MCEDRSGRFFIGHLANGQQITDGDYLTQSQTYFIPATILNTKELCIVQRTQTLDTRDTHENKTKSETKNDDDREKEIREHFIRRKDNLTHSCYSQSAVRVHH